MNQKKQNLKDKISNIKRKINVDKNCCVGLQKEQIGSFESDRRYPKLLEEKLKQLEKSNNIFDKNICIICNREIEKTRLEINPTTNKCSKCKNIIE